MSSPNSRENAHFGLSSFEITSRNRATLLRLERQRHDNANSKPKGQKRENVFSPERIKVHTASVLVGGVGVLRR